MYDAISKTSCGGASLSRFLIFIGSLSLAACQPAGSFVPQEPVCSGAEPYSGAALRRPIDDAALRIVATNQSGISSAEVARLQGGFARAQQATQAPQLAAAVWQSGGKPWQAVDGTKDDRLFYWASVGKIVTAAAILQLEQSGQLTIDDPISDYVSGVPNGTDISLRMLLTHTSGLYSVNEDPIVRRAQAPLDLAGVLAVLQRQPPYACPGERWRYSNSGYTLLGAVIEAVTGKPYHEAAGDLVLSRSNAKAIRVLAPDDQLSDVVLPNGDLPFDIRGPQAAGGIVADAESMALFLADLLSGQILPKATVRSMVQDLYPMFQPEMWYGQGLIVYELPSSPEGTIWIGHSGGVPGARAVVAFSPELNAIVAVALTGEGSAEATANLLFSALDRAP